MTGQGAAHGKVILLGEHAVVYGAPALAAGIDRGARALAEGTRGPSTLALGGRTFAADHGSTEDLSRALAALLGDRAHVTVVASADLPPGGGLGCSAALGVAIARAVLSLDGAPGNEDVLALATAWERVFHGNPSGVDTAAAAYGGCIVYSRAEGVRRIAPKGPVTIAVGSSGPGASTRAMVESVARMHARRPELVDRSVEGIGALVKNATLAIMGGDLAALGKLMDLNQMLLAGLMVSTEAIEAMCALAREAGALGAKLTGSGGGGSVIALLPPPLDDEPVAARVLEAWRKAGYEGFVTRIAATEATS